VVVDSAETAKALLTKGQLRNRVTIIPLDKVSTKGVPDRAKKAAAQMAPGGAARVALELVGYDSELTSAMKYVFGSSFVCKVRPLTGQNRLARGTGALLSKYNDLPFCDGPSLYVLQDSATAKRLAFSREVGSRCITLDGDDFNPSGTLTGGSRRKGGSVLSKVQALCEAEATLLEHQKALHGAQSELNVSNIPIP
jgi:structural maintenance of chromosome 2